MSSIDHTVREPRILPWKRKTRSSTDPTQKTPTSIDRSAADDHWQVNGEAPIAELTQHHFRARVLRSDWHCTGVARNVFRRGSVTRFLSPRRSVRRQPLLKNDLTVSTFGLSRDCSRVLSLPAAPLLLYPPLIPRRQSQVRLDFFKRQTLDSFPAIYDFLYLLFDR